MARVTAVLSFLAMPLFCVLEQASAGCGDYVIMLGSHEPETMAVPRSEHREFGRFATPEGAEPMSPPCHGPRCRGNEPTAALPPMDEGTRESRDRQLLGLSRDTDAESAIRVMGWCCFDEEVPAFFDLAGIERPPRR